MKLRLQRRSTGDRSREKDVSKDRGGEERGMSESASLSGLELFGIGKLEVGR